MQNCDPVTGVCLLPNMSEAKSKDVSVADGLSIHYIGDPMCSWCWGISPVVEVLEQYCLKHKVGFEIHVGGLRAGGGDPWVPEFKNFLRNEWQHIAEATGQPFGYSLLDLPHFEYDTEPACRALVVIKELVKTKILPQAFIRKFMALMQHKFYVQGEDPKSEHFYMSLCSALNINEQSFLAYFLSEGIKAKTQNEFLVCRQMGVNAFPTIVAIQDGQMTTLSRGFTNFEQLITKLEMIKTHKS